MRHSLSLAAVIFGALATTLSSARVAVAQYHLVSPTPAPPPKTVAVQGAPCLGGWVAPGDYDGDGKVDPSVKHDTGDWAIDFSSNYHPDGIWDATYHGYGGATGEAVPADYDGDGKTDFAIKDASSGVWAIDYAADGFGAWNGIYEGYGFADAHPVPADYDGDGRADLSVKTDEGYWFIDYAADGFGAWNAIYTGYGDAGGHPVPADYDGDGRADLSVKSDEGTWYIDYAAGGFGAWNAIHDGYGYADAHPVPADYDGDGRADLSVKTDEGTWYIDYAADGFGAWNASYDGYGYADAHPVPADYDGDHRADLAIHGEDGSFYIDYASDGFGAWDLAFDPDLVQLSPGGVTRQDLAEFDSRWMNAYEIANAESTLDGFMTLPASTHGYLAHTVESSAWYFGDRMTAMVRMFDLTGDLKYLDHLRALVNSVVAGQDARRPDAAARLDPFRGKVMHAWGVTRVQYGDYHTSSATVAGVYLYPIAAFARIVAENPDLQAAYGADAKAAATAALETYQDFAPELVTRTAANGTQNYFMNPRGYATLLTPSRCAWAEATEASEDTSSDDVKSFQAEEGQCNDFAKDGGEPMAYNETLIFVSALVELSRALDSTFYAPDAATKIVAEQTFPEITARAMRYYGAALDPMGASCLPGLCTGYYAWNYSGDPAFPGHPDDTEHGQYEMFAVALLSHNESRLDALLAAEPGGPDQLRLSPTDLQRFANTFLQRLVAGESHLYEDQSQRVPSPIDSYDGDTEGWVDLSAFNPALLEPCAAATLAQWNPAIDTATDYGGVVTLQPHLSIGNHAALLAAKASVLP